MLTLEHFQSDLKRILSRFLIGGGVATISLFFGFSAHLKKPVFNLNFHAKAQEPSNSDTQNLNEKQVMNFSRAVLEIEPLRQSTYDELKKIMGSQSVPSIACNEQQNWRGLSEQAQKIVINYCNRAREIVKSNNLTISQFNEIKMRVDSEPKFKQRIQEALMEIQNSNKAQLNK
ncbi:MAG: hypothetical protein BRC38_17180 [Cyanobacteria bacterium QH_6_48_35]|nr:MAG: hypothetical protein BRC38_17180 [Cyanobacteria bacterium QH_6_48_35]